MQHNNKIYFLDFQWYSCLETLLIVKKILSQQRFIKKISKTLKSSSKGLLSENSKNALFKVSLGITSKLVITIKLPKNSFAFYGKSMENRGARTKSWRVLISAQRNCKEDALY